ncbi:MAG: hypothetical protein KC983_11395 [Phycisphaerales bacterium]|nr:hypothetical protein [Phycisphaerales bacterium]
MSASPNGRLMSVLHPILRDAIESWREDAALAPLYRKLHAHEDETKFFDATAEAMVAHHLRTRGATLSVEVITPAGRAAGFIVHRDDLDYCLHVKRADTRAPQTRKLMISSRLRMLERIARPYTVSIRWNPTLRDVQLQEFVEKAAEFIQRAHVGDESVIRDATGGELGGVLIVAPWTGSHVHLTIGLPDGFVDETQRIRRLLRRAHRQFMPKMKNVILIATSSSADVAAFESALLGAHVERWDTHPPEGRRIAHGRAEDGFWSRNRFADSHIAGWFLFAPEREQFLCRLWIRRADDAGQAVEQMITDTLHTSEIAPIIAPAIAPPPQEASSSDRSA